MEIDLARLSERASLFCCEAMESAELSVVSFEVDERVNQISVADVSLLAWGAAAAVPDGELLGRAGALVVHVPGGAPRMVRGGSLLTFRRDAHRGDLVVSLDPLIWDPEEL